MSNAPLRPGVPRLPDPSACPVELSIVVALFNEADNVSALFERLMGVLNKLGLSFEIVCVNDGSRDDTLEKLLEEREDNLAIKVIDLSRNFGKERAMTAGLDFAVGAAVVPIDADLQDPPELLGEMVAKWKEGYEVVNARRRSRQGETWMKRKTADLFYRVINKLSDVPMPRDTGDFRLLDRKVVEALKQMPEHNRFMKGLFAWVGFKQTVIEFDREARHAGETSWNYWKLWNFALEGITSFTSIPLKVWSYLGLMVSSFAFLYAIFLLVRIMLVGRDVPGYASTIVTVLFLGGIQLISLGVIGEYLGRIYGEVKGRPLYLIRRGYGVDPESRSSSDTESA